MRQSVRTLPIPRALLLGLQEEGINPAFVLAQIGVVGAPADAVRLSWDELVALLAAAVRAARDETFAVRLGSMIRPETFGVIGIMMMASPTFGAALHNVARYKRLIADQELALVHRGQTVAVGLRFLDIDTDIGENNDSDNGDKDNLLGIHYMVECESAFLVQFGRWATKRAIAPLAIHVRNEARTPGALALEELTGAPVRSGRAQNELVFAADVLDYPLVSASAAVSAALAGEAERQLAQLSQDIAITARVRLVLRERLGGSQPDIDTIARALGMSVRSLQRRLREEKTSFQEVLDTTRKDMALTHMRNARLEAEEVAFLLGFSHINSFYRAFRRWTGMTPIEYAKSPS